MGGLAVACAAAAVSVAVPTSQGAAQVVRVSADPGLSPSFNASTSDYVSGCGKDRPLKLSLNAPSGSTVSVDGAKARSGSFSVTVDLHVNQAARLVVTSGGRRSDYHVRCLPSSFPRWRFERSGEPQAEWLLMAPVAPTSATAARSHFVTIVDRRGVPIWWVREKVSPFNSVLLPGGDIAWTRFYGDPFGMRSTAAWEVHRLDGSLVRTLQTNGSPADTHDMEPLSDGDYLLTTYRLRHNVDLSKYGHSAHAAVLDGEIQEITPSGQEVWSWNSKDHIGLDETQAWSHAKRTTLGGTRAWDVFHLNSVAEDGHGGLVISARHVNAVYDIDRLSGNVKWKLGGTHTPQSLKVVGDPRKPTFGLQHDARVLPDGTITVFDNRTQVSKPRAVRFAINPSKRTATFVQEITDPEAPTSGSMGSARRLAGADWVISWGGTKLVSEISASGRVVWRLKFADSISYRVTPIPFGTLKAMSLRRAMDRMHPR